MKKYPYIGMYEEGIVTLFTGHESGFVLENPSKCKAEFSEHWSECSFKNITREYLQNTWGVVESEEHAEFIIEVAKSAGLDVYQYVGHYKRYRNGTMIMGWSALPYNDFIFEDDTLIIGAGKYPDEIEDNPRLNKKQITIPLPPKAKKWAPKVGDEVIAYDIGFEREITMIYRGKNKNNASIVEFENGNVILLGFEGKIKKPKSAEDLKIEELHAKLCEFNTVDNYILACDIVMGNVEGLSYE